MDIDTYYDVLRDFQGGQFDSISQNYSEMCLAQDEMISSLEAKGAKVKGWKIVDENETFIISPIFDFQLTSHSAGNFSLKDVTGFEVELSYKVSIPDTEAEVVALVEQTQPLVAIEVMREQINPVSHIACDFFFNYAIIVAEDVVTGDFQLKSDTSETFFGYDASNFELLKEKQHFLKKGLVECIRRGYKGNFFFMTGSLNGMLESNTRLGLNRIECNGQDIIRFKVSA